MEEFDSSPINSTPSSSMRTESITTDFTVFIDKLTPFLYEMKNSMEITELPSFHKTVESLESDYTKAKAAINTQNIQSSPSKNIEYLIQNLGRSLGLVLFTSHDLKVSNRERIEALCKEMMNMKFDQFADQQSEFEIEEETEITGEQETEITMESSFGTSSIDDTIMQIRYGDEEEELKTALFGLNVYIMDGAVSNEKIIDEDLIKILFSRLVSCEGNQRAIIIQVLRNLSIQNHQHKEVMKDLQYLSSIVTSLSRDVLEEQREAVGLLLNLCDDTGVRKKMGRIQGCIVMLVEICNGDDPEASSNAKEVLNVMSSNTHHALHMAEAGYFQPLIKYLKEGSDMGKVLMATALSRMELTDQNKTSLGEQGAIEPLVKMFNTGNLEAKLSALNALQNLSNSKPNIKKLIRSGIVITLLQLLFSVTSVLMALREPASAILAKVAKSESILIKQDIAQQMLSLLNLTSPVIQNHLLEALNNITSHSTATKVRKKMLENGAIQLLLPFFTETDTQIRTNALQLVYTLSKDIESELVEQIGYTHLSSIINIALSSTSEFEIAASLGTISNFLIHDRKLTDLLKNENLMRLLVSLKSESSSCLAEGIAGILIRFTIPNDKKLQRYSVENGIVPVLLNLLSSSSGIAKSRAALCLAQLSENSLSLSKTRKLKRFFLARSGEKYCEVHNGYCSIKSTFCLVKTGAVRPLIQILEGSERDADEEVLSCLSTLLDDEICKSGCNYIVKVSGVDAIMKALEFGNLKTQEKAVWILERIFGVEAHRMLYSESSKVLLVNIRENCDPLLKPMVDKLLGCVQVESA